MEPAKRIASYRDLRVWQKAMDLVDVCYRVTKRLPSTERYGLVSQMQRASISVAANIAEGHGRRHLREKLHHLSIANGSLKETETLLLICQRQGHLAEKEVESALQLADEIGKMLTVLRQRLESKTP